MILRGLAVGEGAISTISTTEEENDIQKDEVQRPMFSATAVNINEAKPQAQE